MPQMPQLSVAPDAREKREPPVLAASPKTQATWVASPASMAMAAICTSAPAVPPPMRSEEHTSELQSLMRISYAVFCLKKKNDYTNTNQPKEINEQTTTS